MADSSPPPLDQRQIAAEAGLLDAALREARPVEASSERIRASISTAPTGSNAS